MTLACLASQSCTELGPAQPQLVPICVKIIFKVYGRVHCSAPKTVTNNVKNCQQNIPKRLTYECTSFETDSFYTSFLISYWSKALLFKNKTFRGYIEGSEREAILDWEQSLAGGTR